MEPAPAPVSRPAVTSPRGRSSAARFLQAAAQPDLVAEVMPETPSSELPEAYDRAVLLEWLARVYRLARAHGTPRTLSPAELDEVAAESARRQYGERRRR